MPVPEHDAPAAPQKAIAREKQADIAHQLAWAEEDVARLEVSVDELRRRMRDALAIAGDCYRAYLKAKPADRRLWNQAWWQRLEIDVEGDQHAIFVAEAERTPVADALHHDATTVGKTDDSASSTRAARCSASGDASKKPYSS